MVLEIRLFSKFATLYYKLDLKNNFKAKLVQMEMTMLPITCHVVSCAFIQYLTLFQISSSRYQPLARLIQITFSFEVSFRSRFGNAKVSVGVHGCTQNPNVDGALPFCHHVNSCMKSMFLIKSTYFFRLTGKICQSID